MAKEMYYFQVFGYSGNFFAKAQKGKRKKMLVLILLKMNVCGNNLKKN